MTLGMTSGRESARDQFGRGKGLLLRNAAGGRRCAIFASFLALVELRQVAGDDGAVHRPGITTADE